jgi:chitin synthase
MPVTNDSRADWYWEQMVFLRSNFRRGFMGYTKSEVTKRAATVSGRNTVIYRGYVYDMTGYIQNNGGGISVPAGQQAPSDTDRQFMNDQVVSLFQRFSGQDITNYIDGLQIQSDALAAQRVCLRNLFFIGKVDSRNSVQCQFSRYILLAFSIVMVSIIGFKFIAALQFGRARQPENRDRFVILQVPCYTEGEDSLKECMESLAALKYDDKRKLLFVICDGMIIGSGNDRPTPRIVLDILGADPSMDPEPLSFQSLGEGNKQHNMGKVYSGLYEHAGHVIPYIVMVKVGKPSERYRPGNRGKRDSQMILMRFLNRVHFDAPMSPCELEIYHQIKNVIGVNPTFYEFLLAIDADTVVDPLALNRFISAMVHDRKVIATCGETELSNSKKSMISMMQVYEYFISHYLAKAFESLFGSVTCLPGCFSLYRLRSVENKPIFIANDVVIAFGENRVDVSRYRQVRLFLADCVTYRLCI